MKPLKPVDYGILSELVKNSRLSDRQLAKKLKTSQPTVTRRRTQLEKEGLLDYTAILEVGKLGFEILAITFAKWKSDVQMGKGLEGAEDFYSRYPNVIFVSTGRGLDFDRVTISVHKSYSDYSRFMSELVQDWEPYCRRPESFIVSFQADDIFRNLTFRYLAELIRHNSFKGKSEGSE